MNFEHAKRAATPGTDSPQAVDMADIDTLYKMAEVSRILKHATSAIEKLAQIASGTSDLTLMHCLVLVHLSRTHSCKQVDLKSVTGITPAHLTKLVDELANRSFVRRHRSSGDRRQVILALTMAGRETALRVMASLRSHSNDVPLGAIEELGSSLAHWVAVTERA